MTKELLNQKIQDVKEDIVKALKKCDFILAKDLERDLKDLTKMMKIFK